VNAVSDRALQGLLADLAELLSGCSDPFNLLATDGMGATVVFMSEPANFRTSLPAEVPKRRLSAFDATAIVLGIVIGSGIFFLPKLVAIFSPDPVSMLLFWVLGGFVAFVGALCYAELATTYPDTGGDYHFLRMAYGPDVSFLFAWGRMTVIQTGAAAAAALIGGEYLASLLPLADGHSAAIYAVVIVVGLTVINLFGLDAGKLTQNVLTLTVGVGLLMVAVAGFWLWAAGGVEGEVALALETGAVEAGASPDEGTVGFQLTSYLGMMGMAMIFVLYTYGGWNEAAYLSAEIKDPERNIVRSLFFGLAAVVAVYLLVNLAFLAGLGLDGMKSADVVAAELVRRVWGAPGASLISLLVVVAVVSTVNATIITGARSNHALGRDYPEVFGALGKWHAKGNVPVTALVVQAAITVILIVALPVLIGEPDPDAAFQESGVSAMVAYTSPVFWLFFFLVGLSVAVLRAWDPERPRVFRVPLYPLTPLVFCAACLYMLHSAVSYAGAGSLLGLLVLLAGVPFLAALRRRRSSKSVSQ